MTFRNAVLAMRYSKPVKLIKWLELIEGKLTGHDGRVFTLETDQAVIKVKPWQIFLA